MNLPVADMIYITRSLNRRLDRPYARAWLDELGIPPKRKAGKLSGGQRAQLALTLALARGPGCWCWMSRWPCSTRSPGTTSWPRSWRRSRLPPAGSAACQGLDSTLDGMENFISNGFILKVLPVLIGAFVGAPVLARELAPWPGC